MKLQNQVSSLELSQKLKELGVPQKNHCLHAYFMNGGEPVQAKDGGVLVDAEYYKENDEDYWRMKLISAYSVAELGDFLWKAFEAHGWKLLYKAYSDVIFHGDTNYIGELNIVRLMQKPDMACKMLIYLIEQGLVDVKTLSG